jgi:hypothetical protein
MDDENQMRRRGQQDPDLMILHAVTPTILPPTRRGNRFAGALGSRDGRENTLPGAVYDIKQ